MKKYTLLIIIGGLFLIAGVVLSFNKKKNVIYIYDDASLSQDEAYSLIIEKTKQIIDIYENQNSTFEIVEEPNEDNTEIKEYLKVNNYEEIIKKIFNDNGIEELETIKFNDKKFIEKKEDGIYILSTIPKDNLYSNTSISVSNIVITLDNIKATVSFTRDEVDKDDILTYYIFEKGIELVKNDDKWLVKSFNYANV